MNQLTKRKLKAKITRISVVEVLSMLDIQHVTGGAIDIKGEDLVEMAFLAQHEHERAGIKFTRLINDNRISLFFNATDCPFPQGGFIEAIVLDDMIVCKKINQT